MRFLSELFGSKKPEIITYNINRRKARHSIDIPTQLLDSTGKLWSCKLVDMSESGFGITTTAMLIKGSSVRLVRPDIIAEVIWAQDNRAGLKPIM
jgi:hypothetical protein